MCWSEKRRPSAWPGRRRWEARLLLAGRQREGSPVLTLVTLPLTSVLQEA